MSDIDDNLEKNYENQGVEEMKLKNLLPIKTKSGIVPRVIVDKNEQIDTIPPAIEKESDKNEESEPEEMFILQNEEFDPSKPVTTADLLASREKMLRLKKIHIGTLSAGLLENPEEKIMNFKTLLTIMTEDTAQVFLTVKKLATVSLLEVFKDILPSYPIKQQDTGDIKCM